MAKKPTTPIIPNELIEALKSKKEENENSERLIKINSAIANKQRDLTEIQITQLVALRDTLSSDTLTTLEEKREANSVAEETLSLLKDIASNTEEDKFDFNAKDGILSKILSLTSGLLIGFTAGLFQGIIESVKSFKFPTFKKISAKLFSPIIRVFEALADIKKKLSTGQFLKGDTRKIFGAKTIKGLQRIFKFIDNVGKWVRSAGKSIKTFGSILKGGLAKLFSPIITWFKSLKGVLLEVKTFFSSANAKPSLLSKILTPIKNVLGMAKKFKGIFMKLGRLFGKLFVPFTIVLSVFDGIMAGLKEFKTSEYDNIFMKLLDTAFAFLGGVAGSFIGGIVDMVKGAFSWVAKKLGFEGLSEWLDSFSIADMVKEGMSNLLDMLDMLFTDMIPALIAGVKAAANPLDGKSFEDGFNERMVEGEQARTKGKAEREQKEIDSNIAKQQEVLALQKEEGASAEDIQKTEKTITNLTLDREKTQATIDYVPGEGGTKSNKAWQEANMNARDTRVKNEALIAKQQKELDSGDSKGGLLGFQYEREERIIELQAEIDEADRVLDVKSRKLLMNKEIAAGGVQDDKEIAAGGVQKARLDFDKHAFGSAEKDESIKGLFMKKGYKEDSIDLNNLTTGQRMMLDKRGILKDQSRLKAEAKDTSLEETAVKSNMLKGALSTTADQPNLLEKMVSVAKIPLTAKEPSTDQYLGAISKSPPTDGAMMEAIQDDTLDAKSAAASKVISPIITTTDASSNTTNSVNKTVNQLNHFDKTMMMGYGQALMQ
jgi:hypothetical protein